MDLQNMDLNGGSLQISTEVIGKIARCAALEIEGVAEVSCGKQNRKVKDLLERANVQSPVTVEMRDGTAEITLEIVAAFGARIPAVAEKVQENVKSAVQNMTNVTVSRVDLVIAGLAPAAEPQAWAEKQNVKENCGRPSRKREGLAAVRGTLWKIFCPVVKHAKMHFCWHFLRPLVTFPCRRLWTTTTSVMKSIRWMFLASACCGLIMSIPQRWTTSSAPICATGRWSVCPA